MSAVPGVTSAVLIVCQRDHCHARMAVPTADHAQAARISSVAGWGLTQYGAVCPSCSTGGRPVSPEFCTVCTGLVRYSAAHDADLCTNCGTPQPDLTPEGERW